MLEDLTVEVMLRDNCWNPEDEAQHLEYLEERVAPFEKSPPYRGIRISYIDLHCLRYKILWEVLEDRSYNIITYYVEAN